MIDGSVAMRRTPDEPGTTLAWTVTPPMARNVIALGLPSPPPSSNGGCGQAAHVPPTKRTETFPLVVREVPHDACSALVAVTTSPSASAHIALRDGCATPAMRSAIVCVVLARVGDVSVHVSVALRHGS